MLSTTPEKDVGTMEVEVELCHQYSITFCSHVTFSQFKYYKVALSGLLIDCHGKSELDRVYLAIFRGVKKVFLIIILPQTGIYFP